MDLILHRTYDEREEARDLIKLMRLIAIAGFRIDCKTRKNEEVE